MSVCAHLTEHGSIGSDGAALTLETGAELQIGPTIWATTASGAGLSGARPTQSGVGSSAPLISHDADNAGQ